MQKRMARLLLPAVFATLVWVPATAQIRVGVDLPSIHIRVAPDAPPPMRREIRMERPSRNHIWIAGYWDRQDDRWAWAPGRWEEPSQRGATWVKPRYQRDSGSYRYEPGHWSHQRLQEGEDYSRFRQEHGRRDNKHDRNDRDR
jgi:hypothetical protein